MPTRRQGYIEPTTGAVIGPGGRKAASTSGATETGSRGVEAYSGTPGGNYVSPGVGDGMAPYTGWAAGRYAPGALGDQIYDNPWHIIPDVYEGINMTSPGYGYLRDFGADPLSLYNIMAGSTGSIDGGPGDFVNFLEELYRNLGTVGGQGFNTGALLNNIFNADENSTLWQILNTGDQSTDTRTLFNLLRDVSNVGMNPLAARGYQAAVAREADRYGNEVLRSNAGDTQNVTDWMSRNAPWLTVR